MDEKVKGITVTPLADVIEPYVQHLKRLGGSFGVNEVIIRKVIEEACHNVVRMAEIDMGRAATRGIRQAADLMTDPQYFEHRQQRRKKRMASKAAPQKKPIVQANRTGRVN